MRRYSISIHKDSHLMEIAKRHLRLHYRSSMASYGQGSDQVVNPSSLNWEKALYLSTDGRRGIALQAIDSSTIGLRFAARDKYFLVSLDYKEQFHMEYVWLVADNSNARCSFSGVIMPYVNIGIIFNNTINFSSKRTYHGGFPSFPSTVVSNGERSDSNSENGDKSFTLIGGHNSIGNLVDYLKCFDNNPSEDHLYEVMLCVSQPIPGSRDPWGLSKKNHEETGNPVCVGHTFLVLTEKTPNKVVTRNLGFYPSGFVWPYNPMNQGELVNDSYHDFNICIVVSVRSHEFAAILKFVKQGNTKGFMYDLNSNNCTTFALNALGIANIQIPRTIGYWKGGSGCNPGDLGEDLKTIPLSKNMKRITVYQAHGNKGNCIL